MISKTFTRIIIRLGYILLIFLLVNTTAPITYAQELSRCDELAAHPNDPDSLAEGVPNGEIDPEAAIPACEAALADNPDDPLIQFQLGRAYWEADRDQDAIEMFRAAAIEGDHAAAYAFLGIAYEYGYVDDQWQPELARNFYQVALEKGYERAQDLLDALPSAEPMNPPEDADPVIFMDYKQPVILRNIYDRDFDALNENSGKVLFYLKGMYGFFQMDVNWFDMSCTYLHDTRLMQKVVRNLLGMRRGELETNANGISVRLQQFFQDRIAREGAAGLITGLMEAQILPEEGKRDGGHLADEHSCNGDIVKRLYKNAQYYFLNEMRLN